MNNSMSSWSDPHLNTRRILEQKELPNLKVPQLKEIIKEFNTLNVNGPSLPRLTMSGTKPDLINKIVIRLATLSQGRNEESFQSHLGIIHGFTNQAAAARPARQRPRVTTSKPQYTTVVLPPRQDHVHSQARTFTSNNVWWDRIEFKRSPFYEPIGRVSSAKICSEARDMRSSVNLDIHLSQQQLTTLAAASDRPSEQAQLRFFCTSTDSLNTNLPALMEYPPICELKVNGHVVSGSLRGLKNKPGTVNPPNITPLINLQHNRNSVELVYANTAKRYAAAVVLVTARSVDSIVKEIKSMRFVTKEDVLTRIRTRNADSDIVVGSSVVSIKCPLGFIRINLPCRSRLCQHIQCFDAFTFFHMNEQTPTWTCPVCTNVISSWEELVIDGYFSDILANTPQDQDSIVIEEDGTWRPAKDMSSTPLSASPPPSSKKRSVSALLDNTPATSHTDDITVIDDEDDNMETPQPSIRSTDTPVSQRSSKKQRAPEVIDLTLSSDEEDDPVPEKMQTSDAARDVSTDSAPVKAEASQDDPTASITLSNGRLNILPAPATYNSNGEHAPYGNGSTSWSGTFSPTAAVDISQPGIERQQLWLPPLRNDSGSPRQYPSPLRNLSPVSSSSQLSSNHEHSTPAPRSSTSRQAVESWSTYHGERENGSERSYSSHSHPAVPSSSSNNQLVAVTSSATPRPVPDVPVNGNPSFFNTFFSNTSQNQQQRITSLPQESVTLESSALPVLPAIQTSSGDDTQWDQS